MIFKFKKQNYKKTGVGFTTLELIMVVAVLFILGVISISGMSSISNKSYLSSDVEVVKSALLKARTMSINGIGGTEHGIYLASTSVTIFQGTNVVGATTDSVYNLSHGVISSVSLSNATTSFYFSKITGNPSAFGNLVLSEKNASTTITVYASGLSE
ncbi:MAG: hypothetical protein WCV55_00920 [Candidatus Paceibacterota bacterium]